MHIYRSTPHCSICNSFIFVFLIICSSNNIKEMPYIKPDHPVVDTPEPIIPKTPVMEPLKPNTRQVKSDDDSSSRNLFSRSSKSKIPNMLTDGGKKKEFMNTMFLQGRSSHIYYLCN